MPLSIVQLKNQIPDAVLAQIPDCAAKFGIDSPLRLAHFLAQCAHESAEFKALEENLNYSADGLKKVFPKYFPNDLANGYARQPEKIASRVYANRMGNGDEASKDGYKYRGRGYIQLTGKDNYSKFAQAVSEDVLNNPDLVATKYALLSAAWFWDQRKLNELADCGYDQNIIASITKVINGGFNGLEDRQNKFNKIYGVLV